LCELLCSSRIVAASLLFDIHTACKYNKQCYGTVLIRMGNGDNCDCRHGPLVTAILLAAPNAAVA